MPLHDFMCASFSRAKIPLDYIEGTRQSLLYSQPT